MITLEEARRLVEGSSRLVHSLRVSSLMGRLATHLGADVELWMLVGLLHDLDYDETIDDRAKHGVVAVDRLAGLLPDEGLNAILRHDHRTGLIPESILDHSLILCDAILSVLEDGRLTPPVTLQVFNECLDHVFMEKPWLRDIIYTNPVLEKVELRELLESQ